MKDLFEDTTRHVEAEDLIEAAFLAGLIDGLAQELAYLWLATTYLRVHWWGAVMKMTGPIVGR